jgi:hypothetical protein
MINKYADFPREIDGIAHALATTCVDTLRDIVARATPEAVLAAAEARALEAGTNTPEAVRAALHACLVALEGIRQAIAEPATRVQIAPASADSEGGEE